MENFFCAGFSLSTKWVGSQKEISFNASVSKGNLRHPLTRKNKDSTKTSHKTLWSRLEMNSIDIKIWAKALWEVQNDKSNASKETEGNLQKIEIDILVIRRRAKGDGSLMIIALSRQIFIKTENNLISVKSKTGMETSLPSLTFLIEFLLRQ